MNRELLCINIPAFNILLHFIQLLPLNFSEVWIYAAAYWTRKHQLIQQLSLYAQIPASTYVPIYA